MCWFLVGSTIQGQMGTDPRECLSDNNRHPAELPAQGQRYVVDRLVRDYQTYCTVCLSQKEFSQVGVGEVTGEIKQVQGRDIRLRL